MDYVYQSELYKPTGKDCWWCKSYDECYHSTNSLPKLYPVPRKLELKFIREGHFRYCRYYKYSKENFIRWKFIINEK